MFVLVGSVLLRFSVFYGIFKIREIKWVCGYIVLEDYRGFFRSYMKNRVIYIKKVKIKIYVDKFF